MAKMNKFFLLIFISLVVFASDFSSDFSNFDRNFLNSSKDKQLAMHQKLKNIYVKSVTTNDLNTKKEVLQRIILSSKTLNLDASTYKKELSKLGINANYTNNSKNIQQNKNTNQKEQTITKKNQNENIKNNIKDDKNIKIQNTNIKNTNQKEQLVTKKSQNENIKNNIKDDKNVKIQDKDLTLNKKTNSNKLYITRIDKKDNEIILNLKGLLDKDSIKEFTYKTNKILELDGILDVKGQKIVEKNYEVNVAQFSPTRLRLVLRSDENINYKYNVSGDKFIFYITELNSNKKIEQNKPQNQIDKKVIKNEIQNNQVTKINKEQINIKTIKQDITKISKTKTGIKLKLSSNINDGDINLYDDSLEINASLNKKQSYNFKDYSINVNQLNDLKTKISLTSKKTKTISYKINNNMIEIFVDSIKESVSKGINKRNLLITIDAGHGGKDSGASAYGREEKHIVLSIALKLEKALKQRGYNVFLTRKNDIYIGLRDRTKMANDKKSDLFISIHANSIANKANANKAYGIETYFLSPARSERSKNAAAIENKSDIDEMNYFSKQTFLNFLNREKIISSNKLAIDIQGGMLNSIPKSYLKKDGGVKEAPFWVLVGALMPAVLIEVGYISHPVEGKNIADSKYQDYLVAGIVNGIEGYFAKNK